MLLVFKFLLVYDTCFSRLLLTVCSFERFHGHSEQWNTLHKFGKGVRGTVFALSTTHIICQLSLI